MEMQLVQFFFLQTCYMVTSQQKIRQELPYLCRQVHKWLLPTAAFLRFNIPTQGMPLKYPQIPTALTSDFCTFIFGSFILIPYSCIANYADHAFKHRFILHQERHFDWWVIDTTFPCHHLSTFPCRAYLPNSIQVKHLYPEQAGEEVPTSTLQAWRSLIFCSSLGISTHLGKAHGNWKLQVWVTVTWKT